MHEQLLAGCRAEPLGSYLKALGVLALVGDQADPHARGSWRGGTFVLHTRLSPDDLERFFIEEYRPTPAVSPWNGDSGFTGDKKPKAAGNLRLIEVSTLDRLADYREAIAIARRTLAEAEAAGYDKAAIVQLCRNRLPDRCVAWLDATVVLTATREVFPPLLGSGGNDGRIEFSNSFMGRLGEVLGLRSGRGAPTLSDSARWLECALFGIATGLVEDSVGQFDPGGAGGANSSPLGSAGSLVNPWDWVFLIEGSMLFASAAARRLDLKSDGRAAVPFTVATSATGFGSSAEDEPSRGEIWAPVWDRPACAAEVAHLIGEGRAEWKGRQARTGLDLARAASSLGVDRGIGRFVRHGLFVRNGRMTAAVPIGRLPVEARPAVGVTAQLDAWLERVRRGKDPSAGVRAALRRVEAGLFAVATGRGVEPVQRLLAGVADLEESLAHSPRFRSAAGIRPVAGLDAAAWVPFLDDRSAEFRVAAALASQRDPDGAGLRDLIEPVERTARGVGWAEAAAPVGGLGRAPLVQVLAACLAVRTLQAETGRRRDRTGSEMSHPGVQAAYPFRLPAPVAEVAAFVSGLLDEKHLERLLRALLLLDWRGPVAIPRDAEASGEWLADPAWTLLAPFFHGRPLPRAGTELTLLPGASWAPRLARGQVASVVRDAYRRLRIARLEPAVSALDCGPIARSSARGPNLAAALLVPVSSSGAGRILARAVPESSDPLT